MTFWNNSILVTSANGMEAMRVLNSSHGALSRRARRTIRAKFFFNSSLQWGASRLKLLAFPVMAAISIAVHVLDSVTPFGSKLGRKCKRWRCLKDNKYPSSKRISSMSVFSLFVARYWTHVPFTFCSLMKPDIFHLIDIVNCSCFHLWQNTAIGSFITVVSQHSFEGSKCIYKATEKNNT